MCNGLASGLCVLGMCRLLSVLEVGFEERYCVWGEVEVVFELVEEFCVRDCIVCFG